MKIVNFLDQFIQEHLKGDLVSHSRARMSLLILLLNMLLVFFIFLFRLLFKSIPEAYFGISMYILTGMILFFSILLVILRIRGWIRFVVNIYLLQGFSAIVIIYLLYAGGNMDFLLLLLPALAILSFIFTGLINGIIWNIIISLTHMFLLIHGLGERFTGNYDQPTILFATYLIILFSGSTYEYITSRLMVQLNFERNLYKDKAHLDKLTGIPNRYRFDMFLDNAIIRSHNSDETFALVYIDLNGFKPVNDTYGHNAGDEVLRCIAARLNRTIRHSDLAARLGGDEFAVIFQNLKDMKGLKIAVEHLQKAIEEPIEIEVGVKVALSGAMGALLYSRGMGDRDTLVKLADEQMYTAKKLGEHIVYFE